MDFFIRKNSTLPLLKMKVIKDGRHDYKKFFDMLVNSAITFTMIDVEKGIRKISCKPADIVLKESECGLDCPEEYYLVYKWQNGDTNKEGRYKGEFKIDLLDGSGSLIVPIREELYINIQPSFVKNNIVCQ